jgi:hypothetical protein
LRPRINQEIEFQSEPWVIDFDAAIFAVIKWHGGFRDRRLCFAARVAQGSSVCFRFSQRSIVFKVSTIRAILPM